MLISAALSLIASFVLAIDAVALAADPNAALSCDINAVISCGTVGQSWQAALFGFPNAFLGLITEPVVITIAVASLGGVRFPRWFMFAAQIVYFLGLLLAHWLYWQSLFVIGAVCPWCLLITISTTVVFISLLRINLMDNNLYLPPRAHRRAIGALRLDTDLFVTIGAIVVIVAMLVLVHGERLFS